MPIVAALTFVFWLTTFGAWMSAPSWRSLAACNLTLRPEANRLPPDREVPRRNVAAAGYSRAAALGPGSLEVGADLLWDAAQHHLDER